MAVKAPHETQAPRVNKGLIAETATGKYPEEGRSGKTHLSTNGSQDIGSWPMAHRRCRSYAINLGRTRERIQRRIYYEQLYPQHGSDGIY